MKLISSPSSKKNDDTREKFHGHFSLHLRFSTTLSYESLNLLFKRYNIPCKAAKVTSKSLTHLLKNQMSNTISNSAVLPCSQASAIILTIISYYTVTIAKVISSAISYIHFLINRTDRYCHPFPTYNVNRLFYERMLQAAN